MHRRMPEALALLDGLPVGGHDQSDAKVEAGKGVGVQGSNGERNAHHAKSSGAVARFCRVREESQRVLVEACRQTHVRCSKLISVRFRDGVGHAPQGPRAYIDFYEETCRFCAESLRMCQYGARGVRSVLREELGNHTKTYLQHFHEGQRAMLADLLRGECWVPARVTRDYQRVFDRIVGAAYNETDREGADEEWLLLLGQPTRVTQVLLGLGDALAAYCLCATQMPAHVHDVMAKMVELIRLFNRHTCRLVLQGEATDIKKLGLARITAKNLALASQSVTAMILCVPALRERFTVHLPPVLLGQFDEVHGDLVRHQARIVEKLVTVMSDNFTKHAAALSWGGIESPTPGVRRIVSSCRRMHAVLKPLLPASHVATVFRKVIAMYNTRLQETISSRGLRQRNAAKHLRADVEYFVQELSPLSGVPAKDIAIGLKAYSEQ